MYTIRNQETREITAGGRKDNWGKIVKVTFTPLGNAVVERLGKADKVYSKSASRHIR